MSHRCESNALPHAFDECLMPTLLASNIVKPVCNLRVASHSRLLSERADELLCRRIIRTGEKLPVGLLPEDFGNFLFGMLWSEELQNGEAIVKLVGCERSEERRV